MSKSKLKELTFFHIYIIQCSLVTNTSKVGPKSPIKIQQRKHEFMRKKEKEGIPSFKKTGLLPLRRRLGILLWSIPLLGVPWWRVSLYWVPLRRISILCWIPCSLFTKKKEFNSSIPLTLFFFFTN